jgi:UDP-glucose 4-epimerase
MLVLVTGGAGYIGSHTVKALIDHGCDVVVLDDLSRGHEYIVASVLRVPLVIGQAGDERLVRSILSGEHSCCEGRRVDAVIHFAAYAYVGESCENPILYYRNNVVQTSRLLDAILENANVTSTSPVPVIFSSSCATYGIPADVSRPITEDILQMPINPYGWTKLFSERMLIDYGKAYSLAYVILRYFNAAGADPSACLGEDHRPEPHLIPTILDVASGRAEYLSVFGTDYPTPDGTCIRDYIHVSDLAEAHVAAVFKLMRQPGGYTYNLGSGRGYSIRNIIEAAEYVTGISIATKDVARRPGDPAKLIASPRKAQHELMWTPKHTSIIEIVQHAWQWHQKLVCPL